MGNAKSVTGWPCSLASFGDGLAMRLARATTPWSGATGGGGGRGGRNGSGCTITFSGLAPGPPGPPLPLAGDGCGFAVGPGSRRSPSSRPSSAGGGHCRPARVTVSPRARASPRATKIPPQARGQAFQAALTRLKQCLTCLINKRTLAACPATALLSITAWYRSTGQRHGMRR